jgi:hypothetical protein
MAEAPFDSVVALTPQGLHLTRLLRTQVFDNAAPLGQCRPICGEKTQLVSARIARHERADSWPSDVVTSSSPDPGLPAGR